MKNPKNAPVHQHQPALNTDAGRPENVTIADVARLAGVSLMTVSRALNRPEKVSPKTLELVQRAVDTVGYVPNLLAGSLRSSKSRIVAAIVPSIGTSMFAEAVEALSDRLSEAGYEVLLGLSGFDQSKEDRILAAVLSRKPDAIFLTGIRHSNRARRQLLAARIPVVESWDLTPTPIDIAVGFSHFGAGQSAARYLLSKRHKRFSVIAASDERAIQRRDGFIAELGQHGVSVAAITTDTPGTLELGRRAFAQLVQRGEVSDALFCTSDPLAQGAITEAQVNGMKVPGDAAIMGFGGFSFAAHMHPSLTTIGFDRRKIGLIAADAILSELNGAPRPDRIIDIGFSLLERDSA